MADKFQLKALITGVDKLSPVLSGVRKNAAVLRKQLNSSGLGKITFGEALQGGAIAAPFVMGVKAAIGFESAMADVKKVVNFESPAQFKAMSDDVLNLSERLPMAAEGIAKIVAAGGQSGIAREELARFAEDAVKMGVAFDQTAEESGSMMATWRTAFRMTQDGVVELADQINYLGNTGPVNTKQLSSIVTEVGALGEVAGFSSAQIAAIGATMVGVKQDVAATGIKNFMLAMTKGTAATKSQAEAFKSLRLDSKKVAEGMQKDSQGTMLDLLKRISEVDAAKRPALLTNLFGSESVAAITPLLTNLKLLKSNLASVGDSTKYAGSMEGEYTSRAATTANALQQLQNRVTRLGITVGSMLLPPLNDFMATVGPIISSVTSLAGAHPWLIKGLLGAAVGFTVLRLATAGATAALAMMNGVASMSPVGMIVRGIAIAAGILIANWSTVAPYFQAVWAKIKAPALAVWEWMKAAFAWSPLGQIVANWGPLTQFFSALWGLVKALSVPFLGFLKTVFAWSPLGLIVANWGPLTAFFGALWEGVKALSVPFLDFLKTVFEWSPLGLIVKHWEPITGFFKGLWDKLRPIVEPMMKFLGFDGESSGDGVISAATAKVNDWTEQQKARNAAGEPVPGALVKPMVQPVQLMPEATSVASLMRAPDQPGPWASMPLSASQMAEHAQESLAKGLTPQEAAKRAEMGLLSRPGQTSLSAPAPGALAASRGSLVQQATQASKAQLEGQMVVRFDNAPPGMRVEQADTNQPGLQVSPQVGYRSLGRAS
ncbi:phage tail tape measure protein [Pseudomonas carassii]|uniref:Phage tail tape measure protein n=1 Tax=Pseudomonas carassii TaxID=3115855 RepID=A0ABU7HC17_9PSED|nr:phage tail tape measure protein [Pseudomonas sp. 137P]MEE1888862.1 phage tail tape measure protein [Pseudomonas sp. 137P]